MMPLALHRPNLTPALAILVGAALLGNTRFFPLLSQPWRCPLGALCPEGLRTPTSALYLDPILNVLLPILFVGLLLLALVNAFGRLALIVMAGLAVLLIAGLLFFSWGSWPLSVGFGLPLALLGGLLVAGGALRMLLSAPRMQESAGEVPSAEPS